MKPLGRVDTVDLFGDERALLLDVLASIAPEQWDAPTVCDGWSVKDIAAHLVADDLGAVSRRRDGHTASWFAGSWDDLLRFINRQNEDWVAAMRRLSGPLITELLRFGGERVFAVYRSLDLDEPGPVVDWAGPLPAPMWLHVAREYTERWLHGQQIYDALSITASKERRLFAPVLDTFVRALPHTYRAIDAPDGTHVRLVITGDSGGAWSLVRNGAVHRPRQSGDFVGDAEARSHGEGGDAAVSASPWVLYDRVDPPPMATVTLDQETAWRMFTRGIDSAIVRERATITGDVGLGEVVLGAVAIIA